MHDWGITLLPWYPWMFGWRSLLIISTSHFRWNCLGFAGVQDGAARGLPASSLPMSSCVGQSEVASSSRWPSRSCWEPWGSHCITCISTSSGQGFSPPNLTPNLPGRWHHPQCHQRDHRSQTWNASGFGGRALQRWSPGLHVTIRQANWRWILHCGVIVSPTKGIVERDC